MILFQDQYDLSILFLERSKNLTVHAGQISFPGGRVESSDATLLSAAIRETEEETGIILSEEKCIGRLDDFITSSDFHLCTFVFLVEGLAEIKLSKEHDAYFYAKLQDLQKPQNQRHYTAEYRGKSWKMHDYNIGKNRIWGVSGWVVNQFFSLLS